MCGLGRRDELPLGGPPGPGAPPAPSPFGRTRWSTHHRVQAFVASFEPPHRDPSPDRRWARLGVRHRESYDRRGRALGLGPKGALRAGPNPSPVTRIGHARPPGLNRQKAATQTATHAARRTVEHDLDLCNLVCRARRMIILISTFRPAP
jgi:hypothetical protein